MSYAFRVNVDYEKLRRGLEEQIGISMGQNIQLEHHSCVCDYTLRFDEENKYFALDIKKGGDLSLKNATTCLCDILTIGTGQSPKEQDIQVEANGEWGKEIAEMTIKNYLPKNALKRLNEKFDENENRKP